MPHFSARTSLEKLEAVAMVFDERNSTEVEGDFKTAHEFFTNNHMFTHFETSNQEFVNFLREQNFQVVEV